MFGIKANGRFLDLKPGSSAQISRKSPFFSINDIGSEATTDVLVFPYTQNNALALELPYQYYSARKKKKIDVEHYDGNNFRGRCTLVIETGTLNLNNVESTEISGYLLYGISNFFQDIKDKKFSDLILGGERPFDWTTNNPTDGSTGFWQHMHATWTDDTIPYVFVPVRNENYYGESGDVEWMNKLGNDGFLSYEFFSPFVPMIRLKYLLTQIFEEVGFSITFDLDDTLWESLLLLNLTKVEWITPQPIISTDGVITISPAPAPKIAIDLKNHVPADKTISDFIVQLFNRYGWAPVFNQVTKTARLVAAKTLGRGNRKDWTIYAEPLLNSSFNEDRKTFAFTNEIDSNDKFPSSVDFAGKKFLKPALSVHDLTAPGAYNEGKIRFCYLENQWFQVQLNDTTNEYEYVFFADNIFNEEPDNASDTFATTISTLPVYRTPYRTAGGIDYYGFFPIMKQDSGTSIGYRTLLFQGMVTEMDADYNPGVIQYPYASCMDIDPLNQASLGWSNVYYHNLNGDTPQEVKNGIIPYWWSDFLKIIQAGEEVISKIWLPRQELLSFEWDDEILIKNIPYLVKEIVEPIPYTGFVQATMKRIGMKDDDPITPVVAASGVFAQLALENIVTVNVDAQLKEIFCDVTINLFSDAAGTIPYSPPSTLYVYVNITKIINGEFNSDVASYYGVSSSSQVIAPHAIKELYFNNVLKGELQYSLDPSGAYHYQII